MSTTLEIRRAVLTAIKSVHPRVWYEKAPDRAAFPYLVYLLQNAVNRPGLEQFLLDVDGWDAPANGSTAALETLMADVDQRLHKRVVSLTSDGSFVAPYQYSGSGADKLSFVIYRDRHFPLEDDDKRIRRRKYIYEVRTFERRRDYHV